MLIEIDTNEPPEIVDAITRISRLLYYGSDVNVTIVRRDLPFGDWRISGDDPDKKPLLTERKSIYIDQDTGAYSNDAIASRNDGRWETQREGLAVSEEPVLYGVTGSWERMSSSERRSISTYLMSLWRLGLMATWLPTDDDLINASMKLFEMRPGVIPTGKMKENFEGDDDFLVGVFCAKRGISKQTATGLAAMVQVPAMINNLTPWDVSHMLRKLAGKEDKPVLLQVAVELYCKWWNKNPEEFVSITKSRYKQEKDICRVCNGRGMLFEAGDHTTCVSCEGTGKRLKKTRQ